LDIWTFQNTITRRLTWWAWASIALGALSMLLVGDFWRGMAFQFIGWGFINLGIAYFGSINLQRRAGKLDEKQKKAAEPQETRNLARLLWTNARFDVFYMLGGAAVARFIGPDPFWVGTGIGIFIQGTFLLIFDWLHVRTLK
jgi:hypothetical protein